MSKTDKERAEVLFDALSDIDDNLLEEADEGFEIAKAVNSNLKKRRQWVAIAACFVILVAAVVPFISSGGFNKSKDAATNEIANYSADEAMPQEKSKSYASNGAYDEMQENSDAESGWFSDGPYKSDGTDAFINGVDSMPSDEVLDQLMPTEWQGKLYVVVAIPHKDDGEKFDVVVFEKTSDGYNQVDGFGEYYPTTLDVTAEKGASTYN
ncbi:MAG: hypothetical protein Q4F70_00740 [Clostridia bacterium]|nr:hypothetical protein [Clostridia bacterium]